MFKDIDISSLIQMLDRTEISTVRLQTPDFTLLLSREQSWDNHFENDTGGQQLRKMPYPDSSKREAPRVREESQGASGEVEPSVEGVIISSRETSGTDPIVVAADESEGTIWIIRASIVGIFYRAPAPGAPPYVETGAEVEPETTVGLLETMKVFIAVQAGVPGRVEEIFATNGQLVEYNTPLVAVRSHRE